MTVTDTRTVEERARSVRRGRGGSAAVPRPTRSKSAQRVLDRRRRRESSGGRLPIAGRRIAGVPLVVPIFILVLGALALTLVLTTKSAQDSYAIDALRKQNQELQAGADALRQQVDAGDSAPALAKAAARQGMRPATGSAEIIVGPDGKGRLRGTPTPVDGAPLPDLNPEPDPVEKIDARKVDDSVGLGDGQTPQESAQPSEEPSSTARSNQTPPTTQAPAPNPAPRSNPDARSSSTPTPDARRRAGQTTNVVPHAATPRPNTAPAR